MCYRLVWVIVVLAATGILGYLVSKKVMSLVNKDTKVDFNIAYPNELQFPAVTMCNQNRFRYYNCLLILFVIINYRRFMVKE